MKNYSPQFVSSKLNSSLENALLSRNFCQFPHFNWFHENFSKRMRVKLRYFNRTRTSVIWQKRLILIIDVSLFYNITWTIPYTTFSSICTWEKSKIELNYVNCWQNWNWLRLTKLNTIASTITLIVIYVFWSWKSKAPHRGPWWRLCITKHFII